MWTVLPCVLPVPVLISVRLARVEFLFSTIISATMTVLMGRIKIRDLAHPVLLLVDCVHRVVSAQPVITRLSFLKMSVKITVQMALSHPRLPMSVKIVQLNVKPVFLYQSVLPVRIIKQFPTEPVWTTAPLDNSKTLLVFVRTVPFPVNNARTQPPIVLLAEMDMSFLETPVRINALMVSTWIIVQSVSTVWCLTARSVT